MFDVILKFFNIWIMVSNFNFCSDSVSYLFASLKGNLNFSSVIFSQIWIWINMVNLYFFCESFSKAIKTII